jgi:hypothetical protein
MTTRPYGFTRIGRLGHPWSGIQHAPTRAAALHALRETGGRVLMLTMALRPEQVKEWIIAAADGPIDRDTARCVLDGTYNETQRAARCRCGMGDDALR